MKVEGVLTLKTSSQYSISLYIPRTTSYTTINYLPTHRVFSLSASLHYACPILHQRRRSVGPLQRRPDHRSNTTWFLPINLPNHGSRIRRRNCERWQHNCARRYDPVTLLPSHTQSILTPSSTSQTRPTPPPSPSRPPSTARPRTS